MSKSKSIIYKLSISILCLLGNITWAETIPITAKFIKSGHTIQRNDLMEIEMDTPNPCIINKLSPLLGALALTNIHPRSPIYTQQIKSPNLVLRHAVVEVLYTHNNIKLKNKAIALQSAAYGQTIKLKNINNGKYIWGIVQDKNIVTISAY